MSRIRVGESGSENPSVSAQSHDIYSPPNSSSAFTPTQHPASHFGPPNIDLDVSGVRVGESGAENPSVSAQSLDTYFPPNSSPTFTSPQHPTSSDRSSQSVALPDWHSEALDPVIVTSPILGQFCTRLHCSNDDSHLTDDRASNTLWSLTQFVEAMQDTKVTNGHSTFFIPDTLANPGLLRRTVISDSFPWESILAGRGINSHGRSPALSFVASEPSSPIPIS